MRVSSNFLFIARVAAVLALTACGGGGSGGGSVVPGGSQPTGIVPAAPLAPLSVQLPGASCPPVSISANFNGTAIPPGSTLWFSSVFKVQGSVPGNYYIFMVNPTITVNGTTYSNTTTSIVPDSTVSIFANNAGEVASWYYGTNLPTGWVPYWGIFSTLNPSGNILLDAVAIPLPSGLPGGVKSVTWSASIESCVVNPNGGCGASSPPIAINWQWSAAAYRSQFTTASESYYAKAVDDNQAETYFPNSDHAGTPENQKPYVIGGAMGGGGSNYTGSLSSTLGVTTCAGNGQLQ